MICKGKVSRWRFRLNEGLNRRPVEEVESWESGMRGSGVPNAVYRWGRTVRLVVSMRDGDRTRYTDLGDVRPKFVSRWLFRVLRVMVVNLPVLKHSRTCLHAKIDQRITSHSQYLAGTCLMLW
jgi:hypothetical protein